MRFFHLISIGLLLSQICEADDVQVEISPIIKESTPGDLLLEDAVLPVFGGKTSLNSGNGVIQNTLQNSLALPMIDYGKPGGAAQIRGLGASSEDVDVQVFGLSLNPPQGGGFDLSAFPQFLWSSYQYRSGPSQNSFNPTASTGTLSLVPWTFEAIKNEGNLARATEFYSGRGLNQVSIATQYGKQAAVVAGYSSEKVIGPSAALSSKWNQGQFYSGAFHFLGTDLDMQVSGPDFAPTPQAKMHSRRLIPVMQNDFKLGQNQAFKTVVFYDSGKLDYSNPDWSWSSESDSQQFGFQSVYLHDFWKLGVSGKRMSYSTDSTFMSIVAPTQILGNLQLSREIWIGTLVIEPVLQGVWVTGLGLLPQGSLGARLDLDHGHQSIFSRVIFSRRIPSLLDRYGVSNNFVGNPELQTEKDWTGVVGTEFHFKSAELMFQSYLQMKENARVMTGSTMTNLKDAHIVAISGTGKVLISENLDAFDSLTLSKSLMNANGSDFPYVPSLLNSTGITLHSKKESRDWEWSFFFRGASSQLYDVSNHARLPGYGVFDTRATFYFLNRYSASAQIENLSNRYFEIVRGYPIGRSLSVSVSAQL